MRTVYLNQAATSFPKPREVADAVASWFDQPPVDTARGGGGHDPIGACRRELAALLGVADPAHVVLLPSATYALNLVVSGLVLPGSHGVASVIEHNSALRPLAHLERDDGVALTHVTCGPDGVVRPADVESAIRPDTSLVVVTHASNVTGSIQALDEFAQVTARAGVPLLIDASQSVGVVSLNHGQLPGRVFVAFSGHKALLGPPGVGGLVVPDAELPQTIVGGTGVRSESLLHPAELPWRHEAGTPNLPGIAGLLAGVRVVRGLGVEELGARRARLVRRLRERLGRLAAIDLLPLAADDGRVGIVSFCVKGWDPNDVGFVLREAFAVEVRAGFHCAPLIHRSLGVDARGSVRASVGHGSTDDDVDQLVEAVSALEAP